MMAPKKAHEAAFGRDPHEGLWRHLARGFCPPEPNPEEWVLACYAQLEHLGIKIYADTQERPL